MSVMSAMPPKIRAIITDWDDTITDRDTIQLVAEAAYLTKPDFPTEWDHFSRVYYSNYEQYIRDFGDRTTLEQERRYQEGLKEVELCSVREFVALELFKGVKHETLVKQSENVKVKEGFFAMCAKIHENGIPVYVLSCNWTSIVMRKVFSDAGFEEGPNLTFITNEFKHEDGVLTGEISDHACIRTGVDKVEHVQRIQRDLQRRGITDGIYYFGDSSTDILPMLETDIGVVLQDGSAIKTLQNLKIPYDEGVQGEAKVKHIKNWHEIDELI